jgi:predicted ATPase
MITYIKINGFKSFHNFEMEFTPFTVIAGANGAGKSNLFDVLTLLSRLASETDNLKGAFRNQRGEFIELFTQLGNDKYASEMQFVVEMLVNKRIKDDWGNESELNYTRLRYELSIKRFTNQVGIEDLEITNERLTHINNKDDFWVRTIPKQTLDSWRPKIKLGRRTIPYIDMIIAHDTALISVLQDGKRGSGKKFLMSKATRTILSSFDSVDYPHALAAKEEMKSWRFLQLNPEDLRKASNKNNDYDTITTSGKNLAAALYRIKQIDSYNLKDISRKLNSFLPNFTEVDVIDDNENKQYLIKLKDVDKKEFSSRVLSEGTLRILALCILEFDDKHTGLLCFEEPENGIHPFRIKAMTNLLKDLSSDFNDIDLPLRQVIVNTHSPVLVGNMFEWENDPNVSIWYAQMRTNIFDINNERLKMSITKINRVIKLLNNQGVIEFSEQERKLTLATVREYLQTADFENTIKDI